MSVPQLRLTRIEPKGLGFGDGSVSGNPAGQTAVLKKIDAAIHSPAILVGVDRDDGGALLTDDGCGDGRGVSAIFKRDEPLKRSLNRPKVFGGGVTMAVAASIGLGEVRDGNLAKAFQDNVIRLETMHIDFGAHTAEHVANSNDAGCGAIDRAPEVLEHVVRYRKEIKQTIAALGYDYDNSADDLAAIVHNYAVFSNANVGQSFSGETVVGDIMKQGKIVKQLAGDHAERRIVLNTLFGYTVNQKLIRQVSDGYAQIFAIDLWRLEAIAEKLYAYQPSLARKALLSELVYTLGVASLLTAGDLPVDLIEALPVPVAV